MNSTRLALLVSSSCLAALSAQSTIVVPPSAATVDHTPYVSSPFTVDVGRFQHLIRGDALTPSVALIREFAYRADQRMGSAAKGRVVPKLTLYAGYSPKTPVTMLPSFASNRSGVQTKLYTGSYRLPTQPRLNGPGPWNLVFKLATPFLYTRSKGNLLLEFEMPGRVTTLYWYPIDAFSGSRGGTMKRFGRAGRLVGGDSYGVSGLGLYMLHPDGRAMLGIDGLRRNYPVLAAFGLSNTRYGSLRLPFDLAPLGASGNELSVSLDILLPVALRTDPKGDYYGAGVLPLPKSGLPARLYGQALIIDAASNRLGIVTSRGIEFGIDPKPGAPTQCVAAADSTQANGVMGTRWGGPIGGPVIRLSGIGLR